ncbi:hypothetical protein KH5_02300 [Urechidicola sp. KH5]
MKLLVFLFLSTSGFAHDYYFAFAEMAYNSESQKFETTISISTHDLEHALEYIKSPVGHLEKVKKGSKEFQILQNYLNRHFKVKAASNHSFELLGFDTKLDGITHFYLESSSIIDLADSLEITFDALMEMHKDQQNKITFYHNDNAFSKPFLYTKRTQTIILK